MCLVLHILSTRSSLLCYLNTLYPSCIFQSVLSITEKCLLKSPTILVDMSTSPIYSASFYLLYFDVMLLVHTCKELLYLQRRLALSSQKVSLCHFNLFFFCDFNIAILGFLIWWEGNFTWIFYFYSFIFNLSPYIKCVISKQHIGFFYLFLQSLSFNQIISFACL